MKKRFKILIFIVALIVVSLSLYICYEYIDYKEKLNINYGYYDFSKEKITERIDGDHKIFYIKRIGLGFEVPNDWIFTTEDGPLTFRDKYVDVDSILRDFRRWTQGCMINISLEKDTNLNGFSSFERELTRKEFINSGEDDLYKYYSIETINNKEFLKEAVETRDEGLGITLKLVTFTYFNEEKREILTIFSFLSSQVPECEEHLNQFVNNFKI